MLDNLFTGTLLASLASLAVFASISEGKHRQTLSNEPTAQAHSATAGGRAEVRLLPATADPPMPIYQLPRVVVTGSVAREPALFADDAPAAGRRAGAPVEREVAAAALR